MSSSARQCAPARATSGHRRIFPQQQQSDAQPIDWAEALGLKPQDPTTPQKRRNGPGEFTMTLRPRQRGQTPDRQVEARLMEADATWREEHGLPQATEAPRTATPVRWHDWTRLLKAKATPQEWQLAQTYLSTFRERHELFVNKSQQGPTTERYALMWALTPEARVEFFNEMAELGNWRTGTRCTNWRHFLATGPAVRHRHPEVTETPLDLAQDRRLAVNHEARDPEMPIFLSPPEMALVAYRLRLQQTEAAAEAATAGCLAYTQVQRAPDILRAPAIGVRKLKDTTAVAITKSKMQRRTGTYAVHVEGALQSELQQLSAKKRARSEGQSSDAEADGERLFSTQAQKQLARAMPKGKTLRAIRKGGAIAAATGGTSDEDLQAQMRHANVKQTLGYLGASTWSSSTRARGVAIQRSIGLDEILKQCFEDQSTNSTRK